MLSLLPFSARMGDTFQIHVSWDPSSFDVMEKLVTFYFHNLGSKWCFGNLQKKKKKGGIVANFLITSPWVNEKIFGLPN